MTVHHEVLRAQLNKYKGVEMQSDGDAVLLGFRDPVSAIAWCLATQQVPIAAVSCHLQCHCLVLGHATDTHRCWCPVTLGFWHCKPYWHLWGTHVIMLTSCICVCTRKGSQIMTDDTACRSHALLLEQALLGANWPNQLQKHKLTRTATLAGLTKSTANSQPAPGQENVPVSSIHVVLACFFCPFILGYAVVK